MIRIVGASALVLLCMSIPGQGLLAKETRGLAPSDEAALQSLPVQVVVLQDRLRPQFAYNYISTAQMGLNAGNSLYSAGGVSYAQAAGAGLAGGLIAGALINATEEASAKKRVRSPYQLLQGARCDIALTAPHHAAISEALASAPWTGGRSPSLAAVEKAGDYKEPSGPRYEFLASTTLSPDFLALVTTIDARAFVGDASGKVSRKPTWFDSLIVVSENLVLPPKTAADIASMVEAEKARFAASGAGALIAKVNAAGSSASRKERNRASVAAATHRENMREAKRAEWSPRSAVAHRATLWSADDCQPLRLAVEGNLQQAKEMLQALFSDALPPRLATDAEPAEAAPEGTRRVEALPGGGYVSQVSGQSVGLGFRHSVLVETD